MAKLMPGEPVPPMNLKTLDGESWSIDSAEAEDFVMVVVYRGLHCPICKTYLNDLQDNLQKLQDLGVSSIAVSSDTEERARKSAEDWGVGDLTIGYDLPRQTALDWGLYISTGISDKEPEWFVEPGLFLIRPEGTLYAGSIQTMPFARPPVSDVVGAIDFVKKKDYPARGKAA